MRKIAIGLVAFLLFMLVVEIFILSDILDPKNPTNTTVSTIRQESVSLPTITISQRTDEVPHTTYSPAIRADQIDWLKRSRDTGHVRTTLRQEFAGTIYKIQRMKYETEIGQLIGTNVVLTTDNISDEYKMNIFAITDNQLGVVSVTDNSQENSKPIPISGLQEGDHIEIITELDLSKKFGESLLLVNIKKI